MNPRWQKMLLEYLEALAVALILAFVIRTFVVQAFKIPSGSMPRRWPSPSISSKRGRSVGVEMMRISRMPASIRAERG